MFIIPRWSPIVLSLLGGWVEGFVSWANNGVAAAMPPRTATAAQKVVSVRVMSSSLELEVICRIKCRAAIAGTVASVPRIGGGWRSATGGSAHGCGIRLPSVVHAFHAPEHHRHAGQDKKQRHQIGDGEPVLAQCQTGTSGDDHACDSQTAPATEPTA